jgi:predicted TIM-barrel fold metal-dependent hydrolase
MRKIDAHLHMNFKNMTPSSVIKYLDKNNIEKCWLLTWEENNPALPSLYRNLPPSDVFELYHRFPERIVPFYAPDPSSENIPDIFALYIKKGLKGCGELKVTMSWDDDNITAYLDQLSNLKLPLLFHMEAPKTYYIPDRTNYADRAFALLMNGAFNGVSGYYIRKLMPENSSMAKYIERKSIWFPGYLSNFVMLEKSLGEYPSVKFIAHGPHFWNNISADASGEYFYSKGGYEHFGIADYLLEKYNNFFCDISGRGAYMALKRDKNQTKIFLEKHAGKILFGTDNFNHLRLEELILSSGLPTALQEKIFHGNAENILG